MHTINGKPLATAATAQPEIKPSDATTTAATIPGQPGRVHAAECGEVGQVGEVGDLGSNAAK